MNSDTDSSYGKNADRLNARTLPFYRECGFGAPVLCLHSSLGSSSQWRTLMGALARGYRVVAPDLYGYGRSPDWVPSRALRLRDEVALIEPLLEIIHEPVHLVGHGYGAAVALQAASQRPNLVKSLTLYEPVFFTLLLHGQGGYPADLKFRKLRDDVMSALHAGDVPRAARIFVDYWSGPGTWEHMPTSRRQIMLDGMLKVRWEWATPHPDDMRLAALARIHVPVLLLHGADSPPAMTRTSAIMATLLRRREDVVLEGAGHMGPVTQPGRIGSLVASFLCRIDPPSSIAA